MSTQFNPYTGKHENINSHGWSDSGHYLPEFDQRKRVPQGGSSGGGGGGGSSDGGGDGAAGPVLGYLAVLALAFLGIGYVSMSDIKNGAEVNTWSLYALVRALPALLVIWACTTAVLRSCFQPPTVTLYMVLMAGFSLIAGPEFAVLLGLFLVVPLSALKASSDCKGLLLGVLVGCWLLFAVGCAVSILNDFPTLPNSDLMRALLSQLVMPTDPSHVISDFEALGQSKSPAVPTYLAMEMIVGVFSMMGMGIITMLGNGCFPEKFHRIQFGVAMGSFCLPWGALYITGIPAFAAAICAVGRITVVVTVTAALLSSPLAWKETKLSNWFQSVYADNKLVVLGLIGMIGIEVANVFGLLSFL